MSHLWRQEGATMLEEDQCGAATIIHQPVHHPEDQSRSHKRRSSHDKALQEAREAHQQVLEVPCILELDIERLGQEVQNSLHWCPLSLSGSCLQSRSLDRHERSLSQCRPERHVTFCHPEAEPILGEDPYGEPQGHLTQAWVERGEEDPIPTWRPEMLHPQEMSTTHAATKNRMVIQPESLIKNYKVWLTWQACFLDTPHWWTELTAILGIDDLKKLAWKICASFLILRCEGLQDEDYTVPPAPKCLSRSRFLPHDPTYQDVHW